MSEHPAFRALIEALKAHCQALDRSRRDPENEVLWDRTHDTRNAFFAARSAWEAVDFVEVL